MVKLKKCIDIIGFPMDLGADRRGVDMGPSALRIAGMEQKLKSLGYEVRDKGDITIQIKERQHIVNPKLKYLDEIVRTSEILADKILKSLNQRHFPLCIGGDHSISIGSVAGVSEYCRQHHKTPGLIWMDAHADMNTEATTPSGNIHGMSLAVTLGMGHERLTNMLGFSPKVMPENCVLIGVRSIDPLERELIRKINLPVYTMADIDRRGIYDVTREAIKTLSSRTDYIHVSFDVDCADPLVVSGIGTPVPGGFSYREAHLMMETIAECGCMASLDIAEINPILDYQNRSAVFATEVAASVMGMRII